MSIDQAEAKAALTDIDDIARRVRQSLIYQRASLMMVGWGALTFFGYLVTFVWPRIAVMTWTVVDLVGIAGSLAISARGYSRDGVRTFNLRAAATFVLFIAFGLFVCRIGHFGPRELSTFWPLYFMLVYVAAGLWIGIGFVTIGLSIAVLTLIGYAFIGDWFDLWMAFVDGAGLVLGGLWMRRS